MKTSVYNQISQLIPSGTYTTFQVIASSVMMDTDSTCSPIQRTLLWIALVGVTIACSISSLYGDKDVTYSISFPDWVNVYFPPSIIHTLFATLSLLVIVLIDQPTFLCLFNITLDDVLVRSVPVIYSSFVLAIYGMLFKIPN